ncbi:hypothetical protein ACFYT3_29140 [Nocardia amikacinitolerans]|uniref:hypothetical protein n=1 Tax=Nocardia amikacinitolerans TaxID=756689 RepID=UPI0036C99ACD
MIETTEFVRTEDLGHTHRIRTAAEATSSSGIAISPTEAAILGWLLGDGNIRHDPITGRWDGCIYQSKPPMVEKLRALLRDIPHGEGVRDRGGNTQWPEHSFRLRRAFVTDLLARARLNVLAPELERWVIDLDREQRTAWLSALIDAEGHTRDGFTRITQVDGDLQNAIRLAVFLSGARPTYSRLRAQERGYRPSGNAGMARPHVAPSMFHARQELAPQPVWWMETVSGSWTIRQGHLITLAGAGNAASLRGDRHRPVSAGRPPRPAG